MELADLKTGDEVAVMGWSMEHKAEVCVRIAKISKRTPKTIVLDWRKFNLLGQCISGNTGRIEVVTDAHRQTAAKFEAEKQEAAGRRREWESRLDEIRSDPAYRELDNIRQAIDNMRTEDVHAIANRIGIDRLREFAELLKMEPVTA